MNFSRSKCELKQSESHLHIFSNCENQLVCLERQGTSGEFMTSNHSMDLNSILTCDDLSAETLYLPKTVAECKNQLVSGGSKSSLRLSIPSYTRRDLRKLIYKLLPCIKKKVNSLQEIKEVVMEHVEREEISKLIEYNTLPYIEYREIIRKWSLEKVAPILSTISLEKKLNSMLTPMFPRKEGEGVESSYIRNYMSSVTFIETKDIFVYEDLNKSKIYISSLYMLSRLYLWMSTRIGRYMAYTLTYGCQPIIDSFDTTQVYRVLQSLSNTLELEMTSNRQTVSVNSSKLSKTFEIMESCGLSYIENSEPAEYNKQLFGLVYDQLREIVVPHARDRTAVVNTSNEDKARESRSYSEAGFVHVLYIKFEPSKETDKEKLSRVNRIARMERGGIDSIHVCIDSYTDSHMYTPPNGNCLRMCMDFALGYDTLEYLQKDQVEDELKAEMLSNYSSLSSHNNSLVRKDGSRACLFEWLSERLYITIRIQSVSRSNEGNKRGKYKVYGRDKRPRADKIDRVVSLYEYEIVFDSDTKRRSLNPYLSEEENLHVLSGKHMSVCLDGVFSMSKFIYPIARIVDFDEIDENEINVRIRNSLKELINENETAKFPKKEFNVHFFDIETYSIKETIQGRLLRSAAEKKYLSTSNLFASTAEVLPMQTEVVEGNHVYTQVEESILRELSMYGKTLTRSIQVCSNEKNFQIFKRVGLAPGETKPEISRDCVYTNDSVGRTEVSEMDAEHVWYEVFEWLHKNSTKVLNSDGVIYSNVILYGFNSSRFDSYKFLDDIRGMTRINVLKILKTDQGILNVKCRYDIDKNTRMYISIRDMRPLLPPGNLIVQCKMMNVPEEYRKIDLHELTKKSIETLEKEERENTISTRNQQILSRWRKYGNEKSKSLYEESTCLDVVDLYQADTQSLLWLTERYEKNDVICLYYIYKRASDFYKKHLGGLDITSVLTSPSAAWRYAISKIDKEYVYITNEEIVNGIIKKSIYGGICVNLHPCFESCSDNIEEIIDKKDYMRAVDGNGLYPSTACMSLFNFATRSLPMKFSNNNSRMNTIRDELNEGRYSKSGYACVDMKFDKAVVFQPLGEHAPDGKIKYSTNEKSRQVYNIISIQDAIRYMKGVRVERVYYAIEFEERRPLLRESSCEFIVKRLMYKQGSKLTKEEFVGSKFINGSVSQQDKVRELIEYRTRLTLNRKISSKYVEEHYINSGLREKMLSCVRFQDEICDCYEDFILYCENSAQLLKLMANSIYGKSLQRPYYHVDVMSKCVCELSSLYCVCRENSSYKNNDKSYSTKLVRKASIEYSMDIGSTLLALSKRTMLNAISIIDGFYKPTVYYMDTDSIYTTEENVDKMKELLDNDLPFMFKKNEIEFVRGCESIVTEAYFPAPKVKSINGWYFKNGQWIKFDKGKQTIKGFCQLLNMNHLIRRYSVDGGFERLSEYTVTHEEIKNGVNLNKRHTNFRKSLREGIITELDVPRKITLSAKSILPITVAKRTSLAPEGAEGI